MTERIGLVACGVTKASRPMCAANLYTGDLFRKRRTWAVAHCDRWYILSAKHGLVDPNTVVAPYDQSLDGASVQIRKAWAARTLAQLRQELGDLGRYTFSIHAGSQYVDGGLEAGLIAAGAEVERPTKNLRMGYQKHFYKRENA